MSAPSWSVASSTYSSAPVARLVEEAADAALNLLAVETCGKEQISFVDVAAGPGTVSFRLLRRLAAQPVGAVNILITDFAEGMLEKATERLHSAILPPQVTVACKLMDAEALDLPDASVTHLACMFGVMFQPRPAAGFAEIARVLAPDGRAVVGPWHAAGNADLTISFAEFLGTATTMSIAAVRAVLAIGSIPAELAAALTAAGLADVSVTQVLLRATFDDPDVMLRIMTENGATGPLFVGAPTGPELVAAWRAFLATPVGQPYLIGGVLGFASTANIAVAKKPQGKL